MFRDDHEAALARVDALEKELAQERADDAAHVARANELEAQLVEAKAKLSHTEAELARYRPPPKPEPAPRNESTAPREQPSPSGMAAMIGGVLLLLILAGVLAAGRRKHEEAVRPPDVSAPRGSERPPAAAAFLPDSISAMLPEIDTRGKARLPGSGLIELRGRGITSEGTLHAQYGELEAVFYKEVTPAQPPVDPNVPIGAAPHVETSYLDKQRCTSVRRTAERWQDEEGDTGHICLTRSTVTDSSPSTIEPRCSMKSISARAIADGAPATGIAELTLDGSGWTFVIDDQRLQFRREYPDDCVR